MSENERNQTGVRSFRVVAISLLPVGAPSSVPTTSFEEGPTRRPILKEQAHPGDVAVIRPFRSSLAKGLSVRSQISCYDNRKDDSGPSTTCCGGQRSLGWFP
jgi:hypothetical protein